MFICHFNAALVCSIGYLNFIKTAIRYENPTKEEVPYCMHAEDPHRAHCKSEETRDLFRCHSSQCGLFTSGSASANPVDTRVP